MIKINKITTCLPPEINGSSFVNDFIICYGSKNMVTIERKMQQCINKISKWTMKNGFKIASNKTKCMHFCQIHKMHNQPTQTLNGSEIPITQQYKFLGIALDSKLSFNSHIKQLRIKCNQTIHLLINIAHTDWGADRKPLTNLYKCLIRSKFDYGCFLYRSARKSYPRELATIHYLELRIALGAFTTFPIESLYIEANEPPLSLRRYKLALQNSI